MQRPCTHFSPASITSHLELSTITGTRAMSGSPAIRFRKVVMARDGVEQALVHVHVDHLGAGLHLLAGDVERGRVVAGGHQLPELGRAGDVGAFANVDEERDGHTLVLGSGSRPASCRRREMTACGAPAV